MAEQPSDPKDDICALDQASGVPEESGGPLRDAKADGKMKREKKKMKQTSPGAISPSVQPPTVYSELSVCSMPYTFPPSPSTLTSPASDRKPSISPLASRPDRQTLLARSQSSSLHSESFPHSPGSPRSPSSPPLSTSFHVPDTMPTSTPEPSMFSAPFSPEPWQPSTAHLPHIPAARSSSAQSAPSSWITSQAAVPTVPTQAIPDNLAFQQSSLRSQGISKASSAVAFAGDEAKDVVGVTGEEVLGHGPFQLRILAFVQMSTGMLVFDRLSIRLLAPPIDHWCKPPPEFAHMNSSQWKNQSIPILPDGSYSQCGMSITHGNDSGTERTVVPCTSWNYDVAGDVTTIVNEWDLVCSAQWTISLLYVYHLLGALITLPILGQASDKIGRKPVICGCALLAIGSMMAELFTKQVVSFFAARMFTAAALSPLKMVLLILLFESSEGFYRSYYYAFAEAGSVVATLVETALERRTLDRRLVCFLSLVPASSFVIVFHFLDESPLWLLATWDLVRGERVARFAARFNRADTNISALIRKHSRAIKNIQNPQRAMNVFNLMAHPSLRRQTLVIGWIWLSLFVTKFCVSTLIEKTLNLEYAAMKVVPILSTMLASTILLNGFKRKRALRLALPFTCGLSAALSVGATFFPDDLYWVVRELTYCSIFATITLVHVYSMELFPTVIRGTGISTVYFCGRLGALMATLLEFVSGKTHPSLPGLVSTTLIFSCMFLMKFLPETKDIKFIDTIFYLNN